MILKTAILLSLRLHTGLDYFMNVPLGDFLDIVSEVKEIAKESGNRN
jgi:hypothetical protein